MDSFCQSIEELKLSLNRGIKDHSLVTKILGFTKQIRLEEEIVETYSFKAIQIYDLSNNARLLAKDQLKRPSMQPKDPDLELDPLALKLKLIVLNMVGEIIKYFHNSTQIDVLSEIMKQSLEIMIIVSRIFFDTAGEYLSEVSNSYYLCESIFEIFSSQIQNKLQIIHYVNLLDLERLKLDFAHADISLIQRKFNAFYSAASNSSDALEINYVNHLVMEFYLKLLKKGRTDGIQALQKYIPSEYLESVEGLISMNTLSTTQQKSLVANPFYDLYLQIKKFGIESIQESNLKRFLMQNANYQNHKFFDIVALTEQPFLLQIWFTIYNQIKQKSEIISTAYRCYAYLIDHCLKDDQSMNQNLNAEISDKIFQNLMQLSKMVMLTLLSQKKQQYSDATLNILKRIVKVFAKMVVRMQQSIEIIKDFSDKLVLVCTKHGYSQLLKSVYCLTLYNELINHTPKQDTYNKFIKSNALDKSSQIFKALKLGYEMQNNQNVSIDQLKENKDIFFKYPHFGILFAPKLHKSLILDVQIQDFMCLQDKFEYYYAILKEGASNSSQLKRIIDHMEKVLILIEFDQFKREDFHAFNKIQNILFDLIKNNSTIATEVTKKIGIVTLYFHLLNSDIQEIKYKNYGLSLNRFSKITKMMSIYAQKRSAATDQMSLIGKIIMTSSIQMMKMQQSLREPTAEIGQVRFLQHVFQLFQSCQKDQKTLLYLKFILFQIHCITDTLDQNEINFQTDKHLLNMYCQSLYLQKNVKLKILRKLLKDNISSENQLVSLSDFKELLSLTEDEHQRSIYAEQVIRNYGEVGKSMLLMLSYKNEKDWGYSIQQNID